LEGKEKGRRKKNLPGFGSCAISGSWQRTTSDNASNLHPSRTTTHHLFEM